MNESMNGRIASKWMNGVKIQESDYNYSSIQETFTDGGSQKQATE